jgi:hypothetical protein
VREDRGQAKLAKRLRLRRGESSIHKRLAGKAGTRPRIVVEDEKSRSGVFRECFAEPLDDSGRCGMRGDAEMEDSSATMRDHEPHV